MPRRRHRSVSHTQSDDDSNKSLDASQDSSTQSQQSRKAKKAKKHTQNTASQSHIDDAINSVANNTCSQVNDESIHMIDDMSENKEYLDLKQQIHQLSDIVQSQVFEINELRSQLKFILSFIGIDGPPINVAAAVAATAADAHTTAQYQVPNSAISTLQDNNHSSDIGIGTDNAITNESSNNGKGNEIKIQPSKKSPVINGNSNLCQSVVTAMYVEQRHKDKRSNSFVISGLPIENDIDDLTKIKHICRSDLKVNVESKIVKVKRVGTVKPGKIQPVLVILNDTLLAQEIIQKARLLRKSLSNYIRQSVYINPNLTRAEATAAYLVRCQKRQSKATGNSTPNVGQSNDVIVRAEIHDSGDHNNSSTVNSHSDQIQQ